MDASPQRSASSPFAVQRSGITRGFFALRHSYDGFVSTLRKESAFRQEIALAAVLIPVALLLHVTPVERLLLISSLLLVLLVELLNSGIEAAIDRISMERHELSKYAKDCGSAAVTLSLLMCATVWLILVGPVMAKLVQAHL
ncbi:diacylglycerol kinase [Paraburkholderia strydomiana]